MMMNCRRPHGCEKILGSSYEEVKYFLSFISPSGESQISHIESAFSWQVHLWILSSILVYGLSNEFPLFSE